MDPISKARSEEQRSNEKLRGGITGKGWLPGQSGNPGGRPKKKYMTEIYQEILEDPAQRAKVKKQIIATMTRKGMAGVLERREAADRTEGKIPSEMLLEIELRTLSDDELAERLSALEHASTQPGADDRKDRVAAGDSTPQEGT